MGDRGGTATRSAIGCQSVYYSRWEIGEEPQPYQGRTGRLLIIADGDRGGTATKVSRCVAYPYYSRWEIGEEPQPYQGRTGRLLIIADGRSGRNRNQGIALRCIPLL